MARTSTSSTRAEYIRDRLRHDIFAGVLRPGQRLTFPELCATYDASVGVTREALASLVSEGLVRVVPHHGHTVTLISAELLHELVESRLLIEPRVIELSVETAGLEWEAALVASYHRMSRIERLTHDNPPRPNPEWAHVHEEFHQALFAACPNERLKHIARQLGQEAQLYRRWSDSLVHDGRDVVAEHRSMLVAALGGDAKLTAKLLREHIERTAHALIDLGD